MEDIRGVLRGKCLNKQCPARGCESFYAEERSIKCAYCTCAPGIHEDMHNTEITEADDDREWLEMAAASANRDRREIAVAADGRNRREITTAADNRFRPDTTAAADKRDRTDTTATASNRDRTDTTAAADKRDRTDTTAAADKRDRTDTTPAADKRDRTDTTAGADKRDRPNITEPDDHQNRPEIPGENDNDDGPEIMETDDEEDKRQDTGMKRKEITTAVDDPEKRQDQDLQLQEKPVCTICGKYAANLPRHLNIHFRGRPKEKRLHLSKLRIKRNQAKGKIFKKAMYCPLGCGSIMKDGRLRLHFTSSIHQLKPRDALFKKYVGWGKTVKKTECRYLKTAQQSKTIQPKTTCSTPSDDFVLDSFLAYLITQLRSPKKVARQVIGEIRRTQEITKRSLGSIIRNTEIISSVKDELLKTLSPSTVKHHMHSLKKLLEYLTLKTSMAKSLKLRPSAIRQAVVVIDALNKSMANLVADQQLKRRQLLEEETYCISVEDEEKYREMSKSELEQIEGAMIRGQTLTTQEKHFYTQFILMDICLTNANRAGVVKNATIEEYQKMKLVKGKMTFKVYKHKTWKRGAAQVVLNDITRKKLGNYVEFIRPNLVVNGPHKHLLFVNSSGAPVKPSDSFPRHWFAVTGEHKKFTPTLVRHREATLSAKHTETRSKRNKIAGLMCHTMQTAEKYYEQATQAADAVEAFELMEENREKEKKSLAENADKNNTDNLKEKAMKNSARLVISKRVNPEKVSNKFAWPDEMKKTKFDCVKQSILDKFGDDMMTRQQIHKIEVRTWWRAQRQTPITTQFSWEQIYDYIRLTLMPKCKARRR